MTTRRNVDNFSKRGVNTVRNVPATARRPTVKTKKKTNSYKMNCKHYGRILGALSIV